MKSIYELDEILSELEEDEESYFVDFLSTKNVEAGIIRLRKDQKDTQTAHSADEIYHVIEGEGFIQIERRNHAVKKGTCIFVPANVQHNFHGNKSDLTVFYVLTGR
jgi:mannose-6-phosphate isomerase-like protein (cupin superfamily)